MGAQFVRVSFRVVPWCSFPRFDVSFSSLPERFGGVLVWVFPDTFFTESGFRLQRFLLRGGFYLALYRFSQLFFLCSLAGILGDLAGPGYSLFIDAAGWIALSDCELASLPAGAFLFVLFSTHQGPYLLQSFFLGLRFSAALLSGEGSSPRAVFPAAECSTFPKGSFRSANLFHLPLARPLIRWYVRPDLYPPFIETIAWKARSWQGHMSQFPSKDFRCFWFSPLPAPR